MEDIHAMKMEVTYVGMGSHQSTIQAPMAKMRKQQRKYIYYSYRVKSFNFNTIRTLRGTRRSTSSKDNSTPSCLTAFRMTSFSSSVWGSMSITLGARRKADSSCVSFQLPSSAIRPVIAASKTGY